MTDLATTTPICGVKLRDTDACGAAASWVVITPWNERRIVCDDCARHYAAISGFLAAPLEEVCSACNAKKPHSYGLFCWCGSSVGVRRYNVDGLWFTLCETHQPLALSILWRRLFLRIKNLIRRIFVKPKEMSAADIVDLTEAARRRARGK